MGFDPELAEMRFGAGLSPVVTPPRDMAAMLAGLSAPDAMLERFPIEPFSEFLQRLVAYRKLRDARAKVKRDPESAAYKDADKAMRRAKGAARQAQAMWLGRQVQRQVWTETAFRERLVRFWADHFTVRGKAGLLVRGASPHVDEVLRPKIAGRFADLAIAGITAPMMLHYLDQETAVGPNSLSANDLRAKGRKRVFGLNENLAREVLELHTLGVDGGYSQTDVRELAELFTGMTFQPQVGFKFQHAWAEPGAETVLGVPYGGGAGNARLSDVLDALEDLATHPETARHIAEKLVVHFVSDVPDAGHVAHVAEAFRATGGELAAVYAALLEHPAAWAEPLANVKPPFDFIASSYRALGLPAEAFEGKEEREMQRHLRVPLFRMGQPWEKPPGPDGWAEEDPAWINPQGLAARIDWAMNGPLAVMGALPDPRAFVTAALGSRADEAVRFAARAAETEREGVGLVLCSPAFQRR